MFKSEEEIKIDMLNNISNTLDKSQNSFIHDALSPVALELASAYMNLEYIEGKLDVDNLQGNDLDIYIYQRTGIKRKAATKSTTTVTITGEVGTVIEVGIVVSTGTIGFEVVDETIVGEEGVAKALVKCLESGSVGNVPKGAINEFPVTIDGLFAVTNEEVVTNGFDEESDEVLLERYYERVKTPATSGNKYHYLNWAKEVTGVGGAKVYPLWNGDNTVKIVIIDANKQPASSELVELVQEYIDPNKSGLGEGQAPIGAFCTVASATSKKINITLSAVKDSNFTLEEMKESISKNIREYLKEIAFKDNSISYAKIGSIILSSEGVLDYSNLLVNNTTSNILVGDEEVAILGEVVIND